MSVAAARSCPIPPRSYPPHSAVEIYTPINYHSLTHSLTLVIYRSLTFLIYHSHTLFFDYHTPYFSTITRAIDRFGTMDSRRGRRARARTRTSTRARARTRGGQTEPSPGVQQGSGVVVGGLSHWSTHRIQVTPPSNTPH